jgi:hypothetical protein
MNWNLLWLLIPISIVWFLAHEAFATRHAKETGLNLKGRWWFDKGWVSEWREITYHTQLTCCVCGDKARFDCLNAKGPTEARIKLDACIAEDNWTKMLIRAYCPQHGG